MVGGGCANKATAYASIIGGGVGNCILPNHCYGGIFSGSANTVSNYGCYSFIGSGSGNYNGGRSGVIGGGVNNKIENNTNCAFIGGGINNYINAVGASIGGGSGNAGRGQYSTLSGINNVACSYGVAFGVCNVAGTERSVAIGQFNNASESSIALGSQNTASGYRSGSLSGCNNISSSGRSVIAGGGSNSASGYHSSILGGRGNCATGCYSSNLGGYLNTASGYVSSVLGGWGNCATGCFSSTIGINACSYLYAQNSVSSGQFSLVGDSQSSTLIARRAATALTTGSTFDLSLDGTGTTNLVIPATSTSWAIRVQYVARVVAVVGSTGAIVLGDSKTQTQEIGVRNVGGTLSILTGSPNSNISLEDPSMSTAQMSYSVSGGNALAMTFTAPIYAGGGSLNIKVVATLTITEVK
jgi:hypothetical protein